MTLFGTDYLEDLLKLKKISDSELASKLGIEPSNLSQWKSNKKIPLKRVSQISKILNLTGKEIDLLSGVSPLSFNFRTPDREFRDSDNIPEITKLKFESIYEKFFESRYLPINYDLLSLKNKIKACELNHFEIANVIRSEFMLADFRPLTSDDLINNIQDRIRINSYYLPFRSIGLDGGQQTAILFSRENYYAVLVDSDRTIDEAHFDKLHEFIHVLIEGLYIEDSKIEKVIDKVCGELIYPKRYLLERYFNNDEKARPFKNIDKFCELFTEDAENYDFVISPKGLARALRDSGLATENSELFKFLIREFHDKYRKNILTYSKLGKMDIDFSNRDAFLSFYKDTVESKKILVRKYPLFEKIKLDIINGNLNPQDLSQVFGLKLSDAMIIKSVWINEVKELDSVRS